MIKTYKKRRIRLISGSAFFTCFKRKKVTKEEFENKNKKKNIKKNKKNKKTKNIKNSISEEVKKTKPKKIKTNPKKLKPKKINKNKFKVFNFNQKSKSKCDILEHDFLDEGKNDISCQKNMSVKEKDEDMKAEDINLKTIRTKKSKPISFDDYFHMGNKIKE